MPNSLKWTHPALRILFSLSVIFGLNAFLEMLLLYSFKNELTIYNLHKSLKNFFMHLADHEGISRRIRLVVAVS